LKFAVPSTQALRNHVMKVKGGGRGRPPHTCPVMVAIVFT
jgi:hypothetical protein